MTPSVARMPAVFFGHGSPKNTLEHNRYTAAWRRLGTDLGDDDHRTARRLSVVHKALGHRALEYKGLSGAAVHLAPMMQNLLTKLRRDGFLRPR